MPNTLAYTVLFAWPILTLVLFTKVKPLTAAFWSIVGGFLILPVRTEFDFPLLPALNKDTIVGISALAGCFFIAQKKIYLMPKSGLEKWFYFGLLASPFLASVVNSDPLLFFGVWQDGYSQRDAMSESIRLFLILIPFILGMQLVRTYKDQHELFILLVTAGLLYSVLMLFEVRMSPQLHLWTYGFFPARFDTQFRYEGFRPIVFLGHGLLVAMFTAIVLGATSALWRQGVRVLGFSSGFVTAYFLILLLLCRTLSASIFGIVLVVTIRWMVSERIGRLAKVITILVLLYPIASILEIIPKQEIVDIISQYAPDRARSLEVRFVSEDYLLERMRESILFGWGALARYTRPDTIMDGFWIIMAGLIGYVGLFSIFGLIAIGVFRSFSAVRMLQDAKEKHMLASHAIIVAVAMADQIPNASMHSWLWFLIGALLGRSNFALLEHRKIPSRNLANK